MGHEEALSSPARWKCLRKAVGTAAVQKSSEEDHQRASLAPSAAGMKSAIYVMLVGRRRRYDRRSTGGHRLRAGGIGTNQRVRAGDMGYPCGLAKGDPALT